MKGCEDMGFKTLEDTFIYKHLNQGGAITNNVAKILQHGQILKPTNLEEAFMIINKNFKFPLKYKVMDEITTGDIILIYSPANAKIPTSMPFFLTRNASGRVVAVVVVDLYGTMNKETGHVSIDPKKLYTLMESAYLAKLCFLNSNYVTTRNVIISNGSAVYSNMFTRVLNKKYALNVDKNKMHKALFLASKFYLINILGLNDNEYVFNYSMRNCPSANPFLIKEVNDLVETKDFENLAIFIKALTRTELGLGLNDLTVRNYLEAYINMYDGSALLALESFPYFLYNVIAVTNGAYLNNQYILEDIVDNNGGKIYADLMNINK